MQRSVSALGSSVGRGSRQALRGALLPAIPTHTPRTPPVKRVWRCARVGGGEPGQGASLATRDG